MFAKMEDDVVKMSTVVLKDIEARIQEITCFLVVRCGYLKEMS